MPISRRVVLAGAAGTLGAAAAWRFSMSASRIRQPTVYLPHGGGPWPFVDMGLPPNAWGQLRGYLEGLPAMLPAPPRAILSVTAHWEAPVSTLSTAPQPGMLYDHYGFPPESYTLQWPAPGDPGLAARARELLDGAGLPSAEDAERGFDHGTFVPLKVAWPGAQVPTVQLSLVAGLDPARHLAVGRALAPLRDEGVLIVGSGMSYHNLRSLGDPRALPASEAFDAWLGQASTAAPAERDAALARWTEAPAARACHPREEHLLPLMVVAGAAGADRGVVAYRDVLMGARVSAIHYG